MNCKYCNKLNKNLRSNVQHEVRCHSNPNRIECKSPLSDPAFRASLKHSNQHIKAKEMGLDKAEVS